MEFSLDNVCRQLLLLRLLRQVELLVNKHLLVLLLHFKNCGTSLLLQLFAEQGSVLAVVAVKDLFLALQSQLCFLACLVELLLKAGQLISGLEELVILHFCPGQFELDPIFGHELGLL